MNFGKVGFLVILLGISLLSACGQKTVIFSGEGENWRVQIEYEHRGEDSKKLVTLNILVQNQFQKKLNIRSLLFLLLEKEH